MSKVPAFVYPLLRNVQSRMPFTRPLKFGAYNLATRLFGLHVEEEFRLLERIRPVDLALDIGGNWGQSIWALKRTAAPRRIISFEPSKEMADRLTRNFARDPSVTIEQCALSDAPGGFDLYTPRYRGFVYDGLASLVREEAENWLTERMATFDRSKLSVDAQRVEVRTLDSMKLDPTVVKIDVQGAEYQVVKGGIETFRRTQPVTIVEAPSADLVDLFGTIGMCPFGFSDNRLTDDWQGATNTVFLSDARRAEIKL